MEWLTGFFTLLGFGLVTWLFIGFAAVMLFYGARSERILFGAIGSAAALWAMYSAYGWSPFNYVVSNPLTTVKYFGEYFAVGIVWSIWRWIGLGGYVPKARRNMYKTFEQAFGKKKYDDLSADERDRWSRIVEQQDFYPEATQHKERITMWIAFWPVNVVVYILGDFVIELASAIWRRMVGVYDWLTSLAFRGVDPRMLKKASDSK